VLYQLRQYADVVEQAAADPAVRALVHGPNRAAPPPRVPGQDPCRTQSAFEEPAPLRPYAQKFASMVVLDADGCARARLAEEATAPDYMRNSYSWRDYFAAAQLDAARPERTTHVRKAYLSVVTLRIKFAVSTPLFDDERWIGVVTGSITAASTLELPRTPRGKNQDQLTVLIGPFESASFERRKPELGAPEYTFLVHPRLGLGQKVGLEPATAALLERTFRNAVSERQFELAAVAPLQQVSYVDPLLGGRWLAAFAPVGYTGYVVLVQTRDDVAIRPSNGLFRLGLAGAGGSAALLLLWGGFFFWQRRRERRR
jgi:serine/threonine-protein kinase